MRVRHRDSESPQDRPGSTPPLLSKRERGPGGEGPTVATRFLASFVATACIATALVFAWRSLEPPGDFPQSVDAEFLREVHDVHISPDWSGLPTRIDRNAALAIISDRSPSDAPRVEELVLANVRARVIGNIEFEGRAWVVSLAIVPPFQGGPIVAPGSKCLVPPSSAYTLDNTFFMYLIDAESGEILRVFGGTTEPVLPDPDCTVPPLAQPSE